MQTTTSLNPIQTLPKLKTFTILMILGLSGLLAGLLTPLPLPADVELPISYQLIRWASLIQQFILLALAVWGGIMLAPRVGLDVPLLSAWLRGEAWQKILAHQVVTGLLGGIIGGLSIIVGSYLLNPFLPEAFVTIAQEWNAQLHPLTRLLYGGITEELWMRWGLMTFLVWLMWRLMQRGAGQVHSGIYLTAILLSAILFGMAHLPLAMSLYDSVTLSIGLYVLWLNALPGLIAGWLFWRYGLEAAIIAHMMFHVVMMGLGG